MFFPQDALFPPVVRVVFAADATGQLKARLDPLRAARAVRRKRARKISDNLIQYKQTWKDVEPLSLTEIENIILIGAVSIFTKCGGWLKVDNQSDIEKISDHNKKICRFHLPNLRF